MSNATEPGARMTEVDLTALRTMAGGVIREFKQRGYGLRHVLALASELLGLACEAARAGRAPSTKT